MQALMFPPCSSRAQVVGECLGGALYIGTSGLSSCWEVRRADRAVEWPRAARGCCHVSSEDFRRLLADLGCRDYRVVSRTPIVVVDLAIAEKVRHTPPDHGQGSW